MSTFTIFPITSKLPFPKLPSTTLKLSPSSSSLNFSSSHSMSSFNGLLLQTKGTFTHSHPITSSPSTIVAAKGYKMKTHKASAKRFRVTGSGKIVRRRAGKQHLLGKKNTKRKLRLSKMVQVDRSDYNNVIGALPYLKVNRQN
ncbi:hypothetical protein Leryth_018879 [Lithospermum erythrorhizon]|nr:hypothetical protein Leryth_018879 [Lithospermum erythrorhizon]